MDTFKIWIRICCFGLMMSFLFSLFASNIALAYTAAEIEDNLDIGLARAKGWDDACRKNLSDRRLENSKLRYVINTGSSYQDMTWISQRNKPNIANPITVPSGTKTVDLQLNMVNFMCGSLVVPDNYGNSGGSGGVNANPNAGIVADQAERWVGAPGIDYANDRAPNAIGTTNLRPARVSIKTGIFDLPVISGGGYISGGVGSELIADRNGPGNNTRRYWFSPLTPYVTYNDDNPSGITSPKTVIVRVAFKAIYGYHAYSGTKRIETCVGASDRKGLNSMPYSDCDMRYMDLQINLVPTAPKWDLSGTSTINKTTVAAGETLTWTHKIKNIGSKPVSGGDYVYRIVGSNGAPTYPAISSSASAGENLIIGEEKSFGSGSQVTYTVPLGTPNGSQICQFIRYLPGFEGSTLSESASQPPPYCATVFTPIPRTETIVEPLVRQNENDTGADATFRHFIRWDYPPEPNRTVSSGYGGPSSPSKGANQPWYQITSCTFAKNDAPTGPNPGYSSVVTGCPTNSSWSNGQLIANEKIEVTDARAGSKIERNFTINYRADNGYYKEKTKQVDYYTNVCVANPPPATGCTMQSVYSYTATEHDGWEWVANWQPQASDTSANASTIIYKEPYVQILNGDVSVGQTCTPASSGRIQTKSRRIGNDLMGSGAEYGARALGQVDSFGSASRVLVGTTAPMPGRLGARLTYSNTAYTNLGNYGGSLCLPNYLSEYEPGAVSAPAGNLSGFPSGKFKYSPGDRTLSGVVGLGKSILIIVKGNLTIDNNIAYATNGAGKWAAEDQMPSLMVLASGNITVKSNVNNLDGVYVAGGNFITCDTTSALAYNTCDNKLTVNGAVITKRAELSRTFGAENISTPYTSTRQDPGEIINFGPEFYVRNPLIVHDLRLQTIEQKDLPPRY